MHALAPHTRAGDAHACKKGTAGSGFFFVSLATVAFVAPALAVALAVALDPFFFLVSLAKKLTRSDLKLSRHGARRSVSGREGVRTPAS